MNKSLCKNCIIKCIMVSLKKKKKIPNKPDYQNTPLTTVIFICNVWRIKKWNRVATAMRSVHIINRTLLQIPGEDEPTLDIALRRNRLRTWCSLIFVSLLISLRSPALDEYYVSALVPMNFTINSKNAGGRRRLSGLEIVRGGE